MCQVLVKFCVRHRIGLAQPHGARGVLAAVLNNGALPKTALIMVTQPPVAEKGFGRDQLAEMQKIIDAEKSDLFDVLAHVAYAVPPQTREVRAANAKVYINTHFSAKQEVFLDFVLSHYVSVGVEELDQEKLTPLLRLKYHNSIADAVADLGRPEEIGKVFAGFQKYLYQPAE